MSKQLPIPTSFDEFYQHYDGWIDGAIEKVSKNRISRHSEEAEDIKQQVYLRIIQTGHLEKFDVTKGSFSHHIYRVVLHVCSNLWDKNTRTPTANAIPVVETASEEAMLEGALVLETYKDMVDDRLEQQLTAREFLDRFEQFLNTKSQPWGPLVQMPDGSSRRKSLGLVYRLMVQEIEPKDIAKQLHVTGGSVFGYIKKIKALAEEFKTLS